MHVVHINNDATCLPFMTFSSDSERGHSSQKWVFKLSSSSRHVLACLMTVEEYLFVLREENSTSLSFLKNIKKSFLTCVNAKL